LPWPGQTAACTDITQPPPIHRAYPAVACIALLAWLIALAVLGWMLIGVLPHFESMFARLGGDLPLVTQFALALSHAARSSLVFIIPLALAPLALATLRRIGPAVALLVMAVALMLLAVLCVIAIYYPIFELQRQVQGP